MSECAEMLGAIKDMRKALRAKYGLDCPVCIEKLPRANPSILLPRQLCRIHKYRDPRPELTQSDYDKVNT